MKDDAKDIENNSDIFGEAIDTFQNADAINTALRGIQFKKKSQMQELFLLSRSDMLKIKSLNGFWTLVTSSIVPLQCPSSSKSLKNI